MEDRDEVPFCGGKCCGWFHCYCTGTSLAQYEAIQAQVRSTDEPALFFCLLCTKHVHREEVKELRSTIAALKKEVDQLRDAVKRCKLTTVQEKSKSYADATLSDIHSTAPSRTKVKVSGDFGGGHCEGRGGRGGRGGRRGGGRWSNQSVAVSVERPMSARNGESAPQREVVSGATRVWGTLKSF